MIILCLVHISKSSKKPLTNPSPGGIIDKLSRETRTQKVRIERECSLKIVSMHNPDGKSL